jgi:hypothetical protein
MSDTELREKDFVEVLDHLEKILRPLAELARKFHSEGLRRDEFKQLLDLLKQAIEHSTERRDLPILATISWFQQNIDAYLPSGVTFSPKELKDRLPPDSLYPAIHVLRPFIHGLGAPPPPPTLKELVDEFDALIEVFTKELNRHTQVLIRFFDVVKPESIPAIIKLIEKNPGKLRGSLGEPLCIWWLGRVLSESNEVWRLTRGPIKVDETEIDAVSVDVGKKRFAVAEIKLSKSRDKLSKACSQVALKTKKLMDPLVLKNVFEFVKETYNPSEAAIVTLYRLEDEYKRELKSELEKALEDAGVDSGCARIYDIHDILESINNWRSEGNDRYRELFETLNKILEAT